MNIPLVDLKAQYKTIKEEVDEAIQRVIDSSSFIMGEEVRLFEQEFAQYIGAKHAVGVGSGTDALHLALLAVGVGPGDEVITVSHTFIATGGAVTQCGAKPVFVDIDPRTYNIDVTRVERAITSRTKALLPVHLYGQPADMDPLLDLAERYHLPVIEDAAQAHGAEYKGQKTGTFGKAACFSFYPAKNLGAYGDAGMVVTNDDQVAQKVRLWRDHGRESKYVHLVEGFGKRLDTIQAAVLRVKLRRLPAWNAQRRQNALLYTQLLGGTGVVCPYEPEYARSVYHQYVIRVREREKMQVRLKEDGISTGVHYPLPLHLQPAYARLGYQPGALPATEKAAEEVLSLPMYPELTPEQIEFIASRVKAYS